MACAAAGTSGYAPAATAAWMAEPSAGPWSEPRTLSGRRMTSAYICMSRSFLTSPPATISSVTARRADSNASMMTRVPNAVDSSSAR